MVIHLDMPVLPYDDAFITFRYVDNFLSGKGLVYNLGQRVWGCSSPLYFLWLTVLKWLFSEWTLPALAVRLNALHFISSGWVLYLLLKTYTENPWTALLGTVAFLSNPILLSISGGGMESFLFVTLLLLTLLFLAQGKPVGSGILGGLSVLARPEGLLLIPLLGFKFRRTPQALMKTLFGFSLILLPWVLFTWGYFGSPIPLPIIAKTKPLYPLPIGEALRSMTDSLAIWILADYFLNLPLFRIGLTWGFLVFVSLSLLFGSLNSNRPGYPGVALFWFFISAYGIGNPLFFYWYRPSVVVLAMVVVFGGLYILGNFWVKGSKPGRRGIGYGLWLAGVGWLIFSVVIPYLRLGPNATNQRIAYEHARSRIIAYQSAAETLNKYVRINDKVVAAEVGALGFYYKGFVYDACGLVSPEVHPFLPVPMNERVGPQYGAISTDFIKRLNPEWVVTMPVFVKKSLAQSDWFAEEYFIFLKVPLLAPWLGDTDVVIYKKRLEVPSVTPN